MLQRRRHRRGRAPDLVVLGVNSNPPAPNTTSDLVSCLRQEAADVFMANNTKAARVDQIAAVAISGAGAAFGASFDFPLITAAISPVVCMLLAYALQIQGDVIALGVYRASVERQLNDVLDRPALLWETGVVRVRHAGRNSLSVPILQVVLLGGLMYLMSLGWSAIHVKFAWYFEIAYSLLLLGVLVAALLALVESSLLFHRLPPNINRVSDGERERLRGVRSGADAPMDNTDAQPGVPRPS